MATPLARIGVLGGTFDPIHVGHLAMAADVAAELGLDQVLLVPAHAQPFKAGEATTAADHRLAMCEAAVHDDPLFEVSRVDLDRGGVTYTVDTLTDLHALYPGTELFFITGADALARLDEWKDADRLPQLATWVGVTRPGHAFRESGRPHILVEGPSLAISSTDVRLRARAGRPIRYLVPPRVAEYIEANGLYYGGMDD